VVKLVISGANDMYFLFSEYVVGICALGMRGVIEPISLDPIAGVYEQQVNSFLIRSFV
jgi:hypothetical protein